MVLPIKIYRNKSPHMVVCKLAHGITLHNSPDPHSGNDQDETRAKGEFLVFDVSEKNGDLINMRGMSNAKMTAELQEMK